MMTNHDIEIIRGNVSTQLLELNPSHTVMVDRGDEVTWFITSGATNVDRFKIKRKPSSGDIFSSEKPPPSAPTTRGTGKIKNNAAQGSEYEYAILWKAKGSNEWLMHDPKIAINT
jgi:hypothetical protein